MPEEDIILYRINDEEKTTEKVDGRGNRWRKVYFGGGAHFKNWLGQTLELCGSENVEVEEIDSKGFKCFEDSGERMYRIWVRQQSLPAHFSKINS